MTSIEDYEHTGYSDAAPIYWTAGWRGILPMPAGKKKSPPRGFTGYSGETPSYPDIDQWCELYPDGNLALRLPDGVIGIDVDHYDDKRGGDTLLKATQKWGELPPTVRTTSRDDGVSGIRLYRVPSGTRLQTVLTLDGLGDVEIVQFFHRYAISWPSTHPSGNRYRWLDHDGAETGLPIINDLPHLPQAWLDGLAAHGNHVELAGQVDIDAVLAGLPSGPPSSKVIDRMNRAIGDLHASPVSRHDTTMRHVLGLLRYGEQGEPGVPVALDALGQEFVRAVTTGENARTADEARSEFIRMFTNQRGHQLIEATPTVDLLDIAEIARVNRVREHRDDEEEEPAPSPEHRQSELDEFDAAFWGAREELAAIYAYSHGRYTSPWSVLGAVLCRTLATVPPWITLPPVIGGRGSLNFFCALVGPSGAGKGASAAVAAELVPSDVHQAKLGSGEGLAKTFGRATKVDGRPHIEQIRTAAVFSVDEIDTVAGLGSRSGATLMPQLRSVYSGETLGFGYADANKAVIIPEHTYRATMYIGVQPGRAGALLGESDGGTPQRFVWLPTTDPRIGTIELRADELPEPLYVELDWGSYHRHMPIPDLVADTIKAAHIARQRGEGDALDGHALFTREKVAAGLAVLNGRTSMNDQDWELSGVVMEMSDRTRAAVTAELAAAAEREAQKRGEELAAVFDSREARIDARRYERVTDAVMAAVSRAEGGEMTGSAVLRSITSSDRGAVAEVLEDLVAAGRLAVVETARGTRVRLP